jgi:hypothetical protein
MRRALREFVFEQPDTAWRLGATRLALAGVIGVTVAKLPPGRFFEEHRDTVGSLSTAEDRLLDGESYEKLRAGTLASLAAWAATGRRQPGIAAALQFARLSEHVAAFLPELWSYNSHLNLFLLVVGSLDTSDELAVRASRKPSDRRIRSMALAFMQLYVGLLYFQSAVSKLRYGGLEWVRSGRTLRGSVALMGTGLGHRLYPHPKIFRYLSVATVVFEALMLPCLVLGKPDRRLLALGAIGFHIGAAATLRISFWHLWALFPTLFLVPSPREIAHLRATLRQRRPARPR